MLNQKKPVNSTMCQTSVLENGRSAVKSNFTQQKEAIDDIQYTKQNQKLQTVLNTSMLVFQAQNNEKTFNVKSTFLKKDTPVTQLSQTLEAGLTSKEKVLRPFWTPCSTVLAKKLWLPKETDLLGSDMSYLNGFLNNSIQKSFVIQPKIQLQKMNSLKTSWPLLQYSAQNTTDRENIESTKLYTRKIRFYPTHEQKTLFNKCFGCSRFLYNEALDWIRQNPNEYYSFINLRQKCMLSDKQLNLPENDYLKWQSEIPFDTRQLVYKELSTSMKSNFTKLKRKQIKYFVMKRKSSKDNKQTFFLNKNTFNLDKLTIFTRRLKNSSLRLRKKAEKSFRNQIKDICDFSITREKDRYYLCLPMKSRLISLPIIKYKSVALDPGVRTFQTFYSPEYIAGKLGHSTCEKLIDISLKEDSLKKKINLSKSKRTRYNLRLRCFRLRTKIKNITNDLHWKSCNFLTKTFNHILLPTFNVSNMVRKDLPKRARVIRSKTVRQMLSLSHYAFKEKLKWMCDVRGVILHEVDESYTTKSCGKCGWLDNNIGGNKTFICKSIFCDFVADRDFNGGRNITIKNWNIIKHLY